MDVDWSGDHDLWITVRDSSGNTLVREVDDDGIGFDIRLAAGQYLFAVGQWSDSWTEYRVTMEPAD